MKLLVIGGSGFVSGTLSRVALAAGHEVTAVTRGLRRLPDGVTGLVADRKDRDAFAAAVKAAGDGWDLVVDSIGYLPEDAAQDVELFLSESGVHCGHFVFISTDFVYHPETRVFPQTEDADRYLETGYGYEKRRCEELILDTAKHRRWTVLRPCHIYGPGSLLGCLPDHGRDKELIDRIRRHEPLKLVGGGVYLQQPLDVSDLAKAILSCASAPESQGKICNIAGPQIVESATYYRIIGEILDEPVNIEELPVDAYRREHPDKRSFLCHRIYDLGMLRRSGIAVPSTDVETTLRAQVSSLID
jgi:nucleoside-diphosphate-sugar epimerase